MKFFIVFFCFISSISSCWALRIVSLAPSITDQIILLQSGNEIVGYTNFCKIPKTSKAVEVASAVSVNVERVFALKPDIVFVSTLTSQQTIQKLKKLRITVSYFPLATSYDQICSQFIELGKQIGKLPLANEIVKKSKARLSTIKSKIPVNKKKLDMFVQIGVNPIWTAIPNTFVNDYILFSGGRNIAENLDNGAVSREAVLAWNPDYIFVVTMGVVGTDEVNVWKSFKTLNASKNNSIYILNPEKVCSPTPVTFVDVVEEIVAICYKQ